MDRREQLEDNYAYIMAHRHMISWWSMAKTKFWYAVIKRLWSLQDRLR